MQAPETFVSKTGIASIVHLLYVADTYFVGHKDETLLIVFDGFK